MTTTTVKAEMTLESAIKQIEKSADAGKLTFTDLDRLRAALKVAQRTATDAWMAEERKAHVAP